MDSFPETAPQLMPYGSHLANLPHIAIVGLGGTITNTATDPGSWLSYSGKRIKLSDLLDRIAGPLGTVANISLCELPSLSSSSAMTSAKLHGLSLLLDQLLSSDAIDGVILTSGTNVMEEVAYWLDLTLRSQKPVVLTGSMRQSNTLSFDGEANLLNAARLAASGKTSGFGSVLLFNDQFMCARDVRKTDAIRIDAFDAGRAGVLGFVDQSTIRVLRLPPRAALLGSDNWATPFDLAKLAAEDLARVDIVYSYVEASGEPITALTQSGVKGIITAGHGAGGLSNAQEKARADALRQGVAFVSTTRTGSGSVYEAEEKGIIAGYDLLPQKARILLQLCLSFGFSLSEIENLFATLGAGDTGKQSTSPDH